MLTATAPDTRLALALHESAHALAAFINYSRITALTVKATTDDVTSDCQWTDAPNPWDEAWAIAVGPSATELFDPSDGDPWGERAGSDGDRDDFERAAARLTGPQRQAVLDMAAGFVRREARFIEAIAKRLAETGSLQHSAIEKIINQLDPGDLPAKP